MASSTDRQIAARLRAQAQELRDHADALGTGHAQGADEDNSGSGDDVVVTGAEFLNPAIQNLNDHADGLDELADNLIGDDGEPLYP